MTGPGFVWFWDVWESWLCHVGLNDCQYLSVLDSKAEIVSLLYSSFYFTFYNVYGSSKTGPLQKIEECAVLYCSTYFQLRFFLKKIIFGYLRISVSQF